MDIKEMTVEALEARIAELEASNEDIRTDVEARGAEMEEAELDGINAKADANNEELRAIRAELEERAKKAAEEAETRAAIAREEVKTEKIEERKEETKMTNLEIRSSKEYINAFASYIKSGEDAECRALLTENVSGTVPVPTFVEEVVKTAWEKEEIMSLVRRTNLAGNVKVGFEISATGAVEHTEGAAAPAEETLTLGIVTMIPVNIKKWITISDEVVAMGGEAFLRYIYEELAYQIAKACADKLVGMIAASTTSGSATSPAQGSVTGAPSVGIIAKAIANLADGAANPVVIMNKATWGDFKEAQYANKFNADPFEGLKVVYNSSLPAYSAASSAAVYAIVGDLGNGAQANFPEGDNIKIKLDDLTLAESDLVKIVGREYIGVGVTGPKHFCNIAKA